MIVECGSCQTRFQLDSSRIPRRGIRVRCSHCKTAFFLPHPDASSSEAADEVAEEAARDAAAPPHATQDLASEPDTGASADSGAEEEEEDWEFNHSPADEDPEPDSYSLADPEPDSPSVAASESESSWSETESPMIGVDSDSDYPEDEIPGPGEESDPNDIPDEPDSAYEIDDSEMALARDSEAAADPASQGEVGAGQEQPSAAGEGLSLDLADAPGSSQTGGEFGEAGDFSASAQESRSADASAVSAAEPDDAGLFGDADQELRVDSPAAAARNLASEQTLEHPAAAEHATDRASASAEVEPEASEESVQRLPASAGPGISSVESTAGASHAMAQLQRAGRAVGWGMTVSLFGLGLLWGLFRSPSPGAAGPEVVALGDFHVEDVRGYWLETARAGLLYTVSGRLVNDARVSRRPESNLRAALVGRAGNRLDVPAAVAGVPLPAGYLRELPVEQLRTATADASARLAWDPLQPGAGSEFLAYFVDVPPEAEGFVLEMAELPAAGRPDPASVFTSESPPDSDASASISQ